MTTNKNYNLSINGLRGICILMVFIYHVINSEIIPEIQSPIYDAIRYFLTTFRYGVEIFFMISGYVIYKSLLRHTSFRNFMIDRFFRIYPTWIPVIIFVFLFGPLTGKWVFEYLTVSDYPITFFTNLLFLPPVVPVPLAHPAAWSLSYEWCFYLLGGLTVFVLLPKTPRFFAILVVTLISCLFINFFPRAFFFLSGLIVAVCEQKIRSRSNLFVFPTAALTAFLLFWMLTGADYAEAYVSVYDYSSDARILYFFIAFILGTYAFATIAIGNGLIVKILTKKFFQFFGNISYAFYLWSPICLSASKYISMTFFYSEVNPYSTLSLFVFLSIVSSIFISYFNWILIEQRLTSFFKGRCLPSKSGEDHGHN